MTDSTKTSAQVFPFSQAELQAELHYCPLSGHFTRKKHRSHNAKIGDRAGGLNAQGYISISLFGRSYLAHRLAWYYMTGVVPLCCIDHRNENGSDNVFTNLREATKGQNSFNTGLRKDNPSGAKGVTWHSPRKKWRASCTVGGKQNHLGLFGTVAEASSAYVAFAQTQQGEFFNARGHA